MSGLLSVRNTNWYVFFSIGARCFFLQHVNRLEITPDKHHLAAACNPHIRLLDVNSNSPQPVKITLSIDLQYVWCFYLFLNGLCEYGSSDDVWFTHQQCYGTISKVYLFFSKFKYVQSSWMEKTRWKKFNLNFLSWKYLGNLVWFDYFGFWFGLDKKLESSSIWNSFFLVHVFS